jgi:peptidoglycan-associated lipoprotein
VRTVFLPLLSLLVVSCVKKPASSTEFAFGDPTPPPPPKVEVPREVFDDLLAGFARIHFALDSAELDPTELDVLGANAKRLVEHPAIVVEVEGHADERGTYDYNLALGAARADAVRKALVAFGVEPVRVRTTTYGEEHPAAEGHDEVAWAENRRAEFRVRVADAVR